ncbi:MAG: aspartyl protease family protein [Acidobacteriia bacterium]|nr:aspartyl protease family protein [Terriglobia bacterium]
MTIRYLALVCFASVLAAAPVDNTLALGRRALLNDGVATAWRLAQQALTEAPQSAAAHEFSGEVLFRRGEFAPADQAFQSALQLDPNFALAWWGRARVADCSSMHKTADQFIRRAHQLDPRDPHVFADWAARLQGQDRSDALQQYAAMAGAGRGPAELSDLMQRIQLEQAMLGHEVMLLASPYQSAELPLTAFVSDATHMRNYGLEVDLNSTRLRLVLDTGASGILISRKAAEKAGIGRLSGATIRGFGDSTKLSGGYQGVAQRVRVGGIEFHDAVIRVADQDSVGSQDGLIGTNVFSDFLVAVDFAGRKLRLNPLPDYHPSGQDPHDRTVVAAMRNYTPVFRFGHLLAIPTRVSTSREVLFIIDSGSATTLISSDLAASVTKVDRDKRTGISGLSGKVSDIYQTGDLFLEFAGFRQKNLGMTAFDMWEQSRQLGFEVSGFLGLPLLELFTLTIDYRDGLVNFERQER